MDKRKRRGMMIDDECKRKLMIRPKEHELEGSNQYQVGGGDDQHQKKKKHAE